MPRSFGCHCPASRTFRCGFADLSWFGLDAPNHFSADALGIKLGVQAEPTETQRYENEYSEQLVSQFLAADVIVIGVPLYNFSIPTQLKAWIDRLAQPGRTFKYTDKGAVGLAGARR